jgi:cell division topological specificity factor
MMSILSFLFPKKSPSASVAKERLQIVLAHERAGRDAPEFLPRLQKELLAVVGKYLELDDDMIKINLQRQGGTSILEINVELDQAKVVYGRAHETGPIRPAGARATRA